MKKINKREIVILIVFIVMLIIQIKAFNNSRADKLIDIATVITDSEGLLSEENITLTALDEAESGISIMLPDIVNTKKISKYIITKKEIIENEEQNEKIVEKEMKPGEKVYLTQEEQENLQISLKVKYDNIEENSKILYNRKVIFEQDNEEILNISGYMPSDAVLQVSEAEIENVIGEITQNYPNKILIGNYDIKLMASDKEYLAKEYSQALAIEIPINNEKTNYIIIEKQADKIKELKDVVVENAKIKFKSNEIKTYLLLEEEALLNEVATDENTTNETQETLENHNEDEVPEVIAVTDDNNLKLEIDDYESDKNYYLGLNYTENYSKKNNGKYTDANLKEVQINYYGYNYGVATTTEIVTGTISDTEKQNLISYKKCIPVDSSGNISISLIDNPFMNRPVGKGFNGWKTQNSKYSNSITTNSRTYEQTLTTNINNILNSSGKYVIDLYPDWVNANVIFVSSSGNSTNSGTSVDRPVINDWSYISTKINGNIKTCTNASSREVNIIVLMNGTLDVTGLTNPNTPYTLTSLYDGTNYGSSSTYLNVGNSDVYLDSDLQLDYIYIYSNKSYSSPGYNDSTDGTNSVTPCIYGNMYNLRIGRGIVSTNNNYCAFAQVQGGYYNRNSSEFKLVIESGKYYTVQLYRAGSASTSTTANAKLVIGCDIDRKSNNNENLKIQNRMASRTTSATCNPYNNGIAIYMNIKSGTIGVDCFNSESTSDTSERNYAGIYVGGHGNIGYDKSDRYLLVEGGNIANIIGGLAMSEADMYKTYMYIKGGNIINITGGAGYTHTYGDRIIQVTGGCVKYSISGGSNGVAASSTTDNGQLTGESLIYVGGDAHIGASYTLDQNGNKVITETGSSNVLYGVNAGSVCGGANGNNSYAGQTDGSYIIIDGNAVVHNNVFGGGNYGIMGGTDTIKGTPIVKFTNESNNFKTNTEYLITNSAIGGNGLAASNNQMVNETIAEAVLPSESAKWIFESNGGTQYYIKNSATNQYIYISGTGGSWFNPTATVTLSATNKTEFNVSGTNTKTISYSSGTNTLYLRYNNGWSISGSIFGGTSNNSVYLLTYEKLSEEEIEEVEALVNIKIYGGNVKNNIYGGANRNDINGTVGIGISGGAIEGVVYGGSNIKGTIVGAVSINVSGGKLGTNTSEDTLFGGGLGNETNVKGKVSLNISEKDRNTEIYGNVYGGSSQGKITNNIKINIQDIPTTANKLLIEGSVFGGGKGYGTITADVLGDVEIDVDGSNLNECNVFGGSNLTGTISGTITVNIGKTYKSTLNTVYGGGNKASIGTETQAVYVYLLSNANVSNAFNGGKAADLITAGNEDLTRAIYLKGGTVQNIYGGSDTSGTVTATHVYIEEGKAGNVYGGNNQGGITQITNVIISGGTSGNVYGGGNQAVATETNVEITAHVSNNVYGGGNQAGIETNTNVSLSGATVGGNVYGGGNEGIVTKSTYVHIKDSKVNGSVYAGGNGTTATVYENVNLTMEGTTNNVVGSVYGGGNQAETGTKDTNNSLSKVNIVGGTIGKNVYGGANTSVVYGSTQTNIGYDTVGDENLEIGDIHIGGTVFGGGEANASGSEVYDFDFISVTVGIDIQIDGNKHQNFAILGSIFGSGNASSTSGTSYITIKNYGTSEKPQSNVSLQRANCATIINSAISLSGATDRTNEYSGTFFSISRIDQVKLKNNSTLFLCNGANLLTKLDSVVDINGIEEKGSVTINEETGEVIKNVDNRVYMLEGKNLNIALNEKATLYGQVQGMFFFGLFTNRNNPATSTGLYHNGYNNGDTLTNPGTFVSNSYVMAEHLTNPEHDIKVDGFYTNYSEEGIIKVDYIQPSPEADVYYMWLCGEEMEVKVFTIDMVASKYATLGTYELALSGFATPNLKMTIAGFSSGLTNEVSLVEPSEIETIELDENKANTQFALSMKTGNIGWQTKGETMFLTKNGGTYIGTTNYNSDNTNYTPTLNFCFYHSQNLSKKQALGDLKIRFRVMEPVDDLNYKVSYIDIDITLSTALFQDDYYEAAITPGQEFGLFTTTDTTITKNSSFSTYYSLLLNEFSKRDDANKYENYKRVIISRDSNNLPYVFPAETKITMLDMATNKFYYYIVNSQDVEQQKYIYSLSDFIAMGSEDSKFDEVGMYDLYYNTEKDLMYENFIFHVTFADSNLSENIVNNSLLMELRDGEGQTILGVLGIQRENIVYTIYQDKTATIEVDGTLSPETIYLGKNVNLNITTKFSQALVGTKTIYDTQYFDKKLGIKISIYDSNGNRVNNDSLLGINFELDGQYYYPRIDGTTRIAVADKVTEVLARIKLNTENNSTLATGDYKIRIESFGSSDGIYYGLVASDMLELDIRIINFAYGLKMATTNEAKIIDYETGLTEVQNNSIVVALNYSSSLNNPNIAVSLYRRDYSEIYTQNYTLVDLQDYIQDTLIATKREKEYVISENPSETVNYYLYLKPNLVTGTYKLVNKLYDGDVYIGETYEYIIIK